MKFRKIKTWKEALKKDLVDDIKGHNDWVSQTINLMKIYNFATADFSQVW